MYAKGLAQGLAHKDSISSRDNYHHLFTQQTFMKRLLYAKGTGSLGSAPVLMELTVHGGERCAEELSHVKTTLPGAEDRSLTLPQRNLTKDR